MAAGSIAVTISSKIGQQNVTVTTSSQPVQVVRRHVVPHYKSGQVQDQDLKEPITKIESLHVVLPVEVKHSANIPVSTYKEACVSFVTAKSQLSPLASQFSPLVLYPPGVDKYGRPVKTDESIKMQLDYYEEVPYTLDKSVPPAKAEIANVKKLETIVVTLTEGVEFVDKVLPPASTSIPFNEHFPPAYFNNLHKKVKLGGTYNYAGARIPLLHSKININKFRDLLKDYDDMEILQYLEFGFPLGLSQDFQLSSCLQNHSSAYEFYPFIDKFLAKEIKLAGITGPMKTPPFSSTKVSPIMTAVKKPGGRRTVFDASFGDFSINGNTPEKEYLGGDYQFTFPTVLDLASIIVKLGRGCLLWKRDLSRWFLQLPVDPGDFDKLGFIWRGFWFLFVSFVWGCRHAGYNAQRVSSAILHILKCMSLNKFQEAYHTLVYIDDFAGAECGDRAWEAFNDLGTLLADLGIKQSEEKAAPPSTKMLFLGIEFDTEMMVMRVGDDKRSEVKQTVENWYRRTVATKEELQSLQGQLMWISRVVRFSRIFVARIISEYKSLKSQKQKKTLSEGTKKDLLWWRKFLDVFNGIELIIPNTVTCNVLGDATMTGSGAWNEALGEFWSRKFPWYMQSAEFPIHQKEFLTVIVEVKVWGPGWSGKRVAIHCDNVSVVETISNLKPKDLEMQRLLREFLYYVTTFKFEPVMIRIPTKDNHLADYVSRNHNVIDIQHEFAKFGVRKMVPIEVPEEMFGFLADW